MRHLVEQIIEQHPALEPGLFVSSAVAALQRHAPLPREHRVRVCNCPVGERECQLELDCQHGGVLQNLPSFLRSLQEEDITEYGAVGLALLYVAEYTDLRVVEATQRGDRADYWMGTYPGDKQRLLEVSGIDNGNESDVGKRATQKADQVRRNTKYQKDFYVSVAEFRNGISVFSRYGGEE